MRIGLVLPLLALPAAAAEVDVRVNAGRLDVRAIAAPLSEVLDRLSKQTGMKLLYEGPPPRQLVTLSLARRTPAQAVVGVLEGLGLNYVLVMDPAGERVATLLMAGASGPGTPPAGARAPGMMPPMPMQPVTHPDEPAEVEEEEPPPPEPAEVPKPNPEEPPGGPPGIVVPAPPNYPASPFTPQGPGIITVPPPMPPNPEGEQPKKPSPPPDR